jgi:DNA-binding transcriptional regulator/RsmH inhibitor MraZ
MDYFERKLDEKNRLTVPKEIRSELGSSVVITCGFKKYLHLYSKKVWDKEMESALNGDILDERIADLNVNFRSGKTESRLDGKQGRILLEPHQLAYAEIKRDIAIIRAGKYWRIIAKKA